MKQLFTLLALFALTLPPATLAGPPNEANASHAAASAPMRLELNRPYIDVTLTGPNGHSEQIHAWVDTGGGAIILAAGLAKRLGLKSKPTKSGRFKDSPLAPRSVPTLGIGGETIKLDHARALVDTSQPDTLQDTNAQMALPARYLRNYVVIFDYPERTFTLADPDQYHPRGTPIKTYIGHYSDMPVVWLKVANKTYGFLMDTGGQICMISKTVLDSWSKAHPDWSRVSGAYGPANMLIGKRETTLEMLRIGAMQWGPFHIENVGAVSRPAGTYEKRMTKLLGKPVIGSIGSSVLRNFRVTVDYPARQIYLKRKTTTHVTLDMVGIMLEPAEKGGYKIVGTTGKTKNLKAGDRLLEIGNHDVTDASFSHIIRLLSGKPGDTRTLTLMRHGEPITVEATIENII